MWALPCPFPTQWKWYHWNKGGRWLQCVGDTALWRSHCRLFMNSLYSTAASEAEQGRKPLPHLDVDSDEKLLHDNLPEMIRSQMGDSLGAAFPRFSILLCSCSATRQDPDRVQSTILPVRPVQIHVRSPRRQGGPFPCMLWFFLGSPLTPHPHTGDLYFQFSSDSCYTLLPSVFPCSFWAHWIPTPVSGTCLKL